MSDIFKALSEIPMVGSESVGDAEQLETVLGDFGIDKNLIPSGALETFSRPITSAMPLEDTVIDMDLEEEKQNAKDGISSSSSTITSQLVTPPSLPEIVVSNVVCGSNLGCNLDLLHCNKTLLNSSMDKKKFPALFVRVRNVTLLLFSNGVVLATGGKTLEDAERSIARLVSTLRRLHYEAKLGPITVENIIAKVNVKFPISVSKLAQDPLHRRYCTTQGRKFSCVNYRIKLISPQITVRIFPNGVALFQSAKSLESLYRAVELMVPVFHQFRIAQYEPVHPSLVVKHFDNVRQYTDE